MPRRQTRYYPDYGPLLPTSGPDWRWARASQIVSSQMKVSLRRDGPDIVRAIRFIRRSFKGVMGCEMKRLLKEDPDLVLAVRFANDGDGRQLELHCRVLAGESAGVIGVEMGLTKSIVQTYCLLFYDVQPRLKATSYILHRVIRLPLAAPPTPEMLMMLCAYYHGPTVIEPWLDYLDHQCEAHDLTTAQGRLRESIELLIEAHNLAFDAETHLSLIKRTSLVWQTRTKMFRSRSVAQVLSENVSRRLGETLWREPAAEGAGKGCSLDPLPFGSKRTTKARTA